MHKVTVTYILEIDLNGYFVKIRHSRFLKPYAKSTLRTFLFFLHKVVLAWRLKIYPDVFFDRLKIVISYLGQKGPKNGPSMRFFELHQKFIYRVFMFLHKVTAWVHEIDLNYFSEKNVVFKVFGPKGAGNKMSRVFWKISALNIYVFSAWSYSSMMA